eukprot:COSAG02_NODE_23145_length_728_cov_2.960254_1_plen_188_part_01
MVRLYSMEGTSRLVLPAWPATGVSAALGTMPDNGFEGYDLVHPATPDLEKLALPLNEPPIAIVDGVSDSDQPEHSDFFVLTSILNSAGIASAGFHHPTFGGGNETWPIPRYALCEGARDEHAFGYILLAKDSACHYIDTETQLRSYSARTSDQLLLPPLPPNSVHKYSPPPLATSVSSSPQHRRETHP